MILLLSIISFSASAQKTKSKTDSLKSDTLHIVLKKSLLDDIATIEQRMNQLQDQKLKQQGILYGIDQDLTKLIERKESIIYDVIRSDQRIDSKNISNVSPLKDGKIIITKKKQ